MEALRDFGARRAIAFPMLSDRESRVIDAFGLRNEAHAPGERNHGVPHPVLFMVTREGVVTARFAEERYYHRRSLATIVAGADGGPELAPMPAVESARVTVRPAAVQPEVYPGHRFALFVDVEPQHGVHLYAPGAGEEYHTLRLAVHSEPYLTVYEPSYPLAETTWAGPLGEAVPVYAARARITVEVALGTRQELAPVLEGGGVLRLEGTLHLQACTDAICWPPEDVPVAWTLRLLPPDLERPPEPLQREQWMRR